MTTEKHILDSQQVAPPLPDNIGISQPSGLDRHCVFSQQRSDEYVSNDVVSTQSARQYKDATDLICDTEVTYQDTVGALCESDKHGIGSQYVDQNKCVVEAKKLIRRLTPLECERFI